MTTTRDDWSVEHAERQLPAGNGYANEDVVTTLFDLTSDPSHYYIGYAQQGSDPAAGVWTIRRITLSSGSPTESQWTAKGVAVWNNRATETYL